MAPTAAMEGVLPWEEFTAHVAAAAALNATRKSDFLGLVGEYYGQLRRYAPSLLKAFDLGSAPAVAPLLKGVDTLRTLNETGARKVPADAPTSFVRGNWTPYVQTEEGLDRKLYELCVMSELKNALRSGDVWVPGSRQFRGKRYFNEAASYMESAQRMFERNGSVASIPSWFIMDMRSRNRYAWGMALPGRIPAEWVTSGYLRTASSIEELATQCGIDAQGLRATVKRFNGFARTGVDEDFGRGARAYDRYFGDPRNRPNPTLGAIEKPPFMAIALYPGDVGTFGGLLTDEFARVLKVDGSPIDGLFATGTCTASVMGTVFPGAGASLAASAVFGYIASGYCSRPATSG